jgi:hypothetical protein
MMNYEFGNNRIEVFQIIAIIFIVRAISQSWLERVTDLPAIGLAEGNAGG